MSATRNPTNDCPYWIGDGFWTRSDIEPEKRWAGTKWRKYEDVMLLAASNNHPLDETGGEETHVLTIPEIPNHSHDIPCTKSDNGYCNATNYMAYVGAQAENAKYWPRTTDYIGGGVAHNNMPPYLARYYWERTG